MTNPVVTNVDGSNAGPNISTPDFPQSEIGNVWKMGSFTLTISPGTIAATTAAEQTFVMTGLLTTDFVYATKPTAQANIGIAGTRCSAAGVIAINFINPSTATVTPTASEAYKVLVVRVQPNATQPTGLFDY